MPATTAAPGRSTSRRPSGALLGVLPFFGYAAIFLVTPTLVVVVGAFLDGGNQPTLGNISALTQPQVVSAFVNSVILSAVTAVLGAVFGALLSYAVATGRPGGLLRRVMTAVVRRAGPVRRCDAGVRLRGHRRAPGVRDGLPAEGRHRPGREHVAVRAHPGTRARLHLLPDPADAHRLPPRRGRPAVAVAGGGRDARREHLGLLAARGRPDPRAGVPRLRCCCCSPTRSPPTPPPRRWSPRAHRSSRCRSAAPSAREVLLGQENLGKAMALGMVVVVAVVMTLYAVLQRRTTRWLGR